jgi:hypothetical protein
MLIPMRAVRGNDATMRWSWVPLVLALGCAGGVDNPDTTFGGPPGGPAPATDGEESEGDELDSEDDPFPDPDPIDTTTSNPSEDSTTGFGDDTTGQPPEDTTDDGGPVGNCPNLDTCQNASGLGQVSGDEGSQMLAASGSEPTWIEFQVTETDDALAGAAMSFTVTLTSPAAANFDLYVYRGPDGGSTGCNGFMQQSANAGPLDSVSMTWGEGLAANGIDDGAWVAVEVRAKDEMCAPPEQWNLMVEGNP